MTNQYSNTVLTHVIKGVTEWSWLSPMSYQPLASYVFMGFSDNMPTAISATVEEKTKRNYITQYTLSRLPNALLITSML